MCLSWIVCDFENVGKNVVLCVTFYILHFLLVFFCFLMDFKGVLQNISF